MTRTLTAASVARMIDHTILQAGARAEDVQRLCEDAMRCGFAAAVANLWHVPLMARLMSGSSVKVCTVAGFPLGATLPHMKLQEAEEALRLGAQELDMVMNVGALRDGLFGVVGEEIRAICATTHRSGFICKVIIEAAALSREEKVTACRIARDAGADFVKTSTGFGAGGAAAEDVRLMRETVGPAMGVKASGGIRTLSDFSRMAEAGANRIGTSSGVKIYEEAAALALR